jgi:transposase InsO family protein
MPELMLRPLHFLMVWFATIQNRRLLQENDYLRAEIRVLRKTVGKRRLLLTADERRELAQKALVLGRKALDGIVSIVTVDTVLRWHRELIRAKWTQTGRRPGRPRTKRDVRALVVCVARENTGWGYSRIVGAFRNLGIKIGRGTVRAILKENGIEPAPERETSWRQFLKAQAAAMAAMDFFTTEVWTWRGLATIYTLFAIDLKTREVQILGSTQNPDGAFMAQVARNITGVEDSWLRRKTLLLADNDTKFTAQFRAILAATGLASVRLPNAAPNSNAFAERFVRSIKQECLDRLILFGEDSLRRVLREYVAHYNGERNHQGIGNELIAPRSGDLGGGGRITVRRRLGGLLNFYRRKAG